MSFRKFIIICLFFLLLLSSLLSLGLADRRFRDISGSGRISLFLLAPLLNILDKGRDVLAFTWENYFYSVSQSFENNKLKKRLAEFKEKENYYHELELSNKRLRNFLNFSEKEGVDFLAAEVVGKDPSFWFKTLIINRGLKDGVRKGFAVVVPEGIVGQVIELSSSYSRVLLITDRMSGADALVQRTRARGVLNGMGADFCTFSYALRRHDIQEGDIIISSGLDAVYPKGLCLGRVEGVVRGDKGVFQEVEVKPFVDFDRLEEVLIILSPEKDFQDILEEAF